MVYTKLDLSCWERREHFEAFQSFAQCTFSQTVQLDITLVLRRIKAQGWKFYPKIIHLISQLVNSYSEFRIALKDDELVVWDFLHPSYTIFHKDSETFSSLWSGYHENFEVFMRNFSADVERYKGNGAYFPKSEFVENIFYVSANPWVSFTGFNFNMASIKNFFAPMFTVGKYYVQGDKVFMPLAVQVHHATCDGFHVGRFINNLQKACNEEVN
ncbi:type A chloramphenicol O-acetyltransferase [Pseudomonas aeruginosa]|nr:type A chloramphenicol O-acetyltransferase [Pseudomonas aeruginosa]